MLIEKSGAKKELPHSNRQNSSTETRALFESRSFFSIFVTPCLTNGSQCPPVPLNFIFSLSLRKQSRHANAD